MNLASRLYITVVIYPLNNLRVTVINVSSTTYSLIRWSVLILGLNVKLS